MRGAEQNRLAAGIAVASVRASVEQLIAHLNEQLKRTENLIREHLHCHPTLQQQSDLLDSIPGIAPTTAATLLAEIVDLSPTTPAPVRSPLTPR